MRLIGAGFSRLAPRWRGLSSQNKQMTRCLSLMNMSLLDLSASHVVNLDSCTSQSQVVDALQQGGAIKSDSLADAFRAVDRALFVPSAGVGPAARYAEPYGPNPQKLFHGATLSTPQHHAIVAELLKENLVSGAKVLDIGCGTGYLCALFAKLVGSEGVVVGSDRIPSCVDFGKDVLTQLGLNENVKLFTTSTAATGAEAEGGLTPDELAHGPFDCIHVGFAIPHDDKEVLLGALGACLARKGRMVAALVDDDGKQNLCLIQHGPDANSSSGLRIERVMLTACQAMEQGGVLDESSIDSRSHEERLKEVQQQLDDWKLKFETTMQRKPNKADMDADEGAKALFESFVQMRKRLW